MLTFDECEHLLVRDVPGLQVDLQSQQQREEQLVFLVQTPDGVAEHLREANRKSSHLQKPAPPNEQISRTRSGP